MEIYPLNICLMWVEMCVSLGNVSLPQSCGAWPTFLGGIAPCLLLLIS